MSRLAGSIRIVMFCAVAVYLGNGVLITIVPIRAGLEGFPESLIGLMGTVHFAGFAAGCLLGPRMITRVGHVRCFAGFGALMAILTLIFPSAVDPVVWCVLRGLGGTCVAVLYLVIESWLNESSTNDNRGAVLSVYVIVGSLLTVAGQLAVNLFSESAYEQFTMAAIFLVFALVPMTLVDIPTPKPVPEARLRIGRMWALSPTGFVGCVVVGFVEGAFWSLGPVFAQGKGMPVADVTIFMAAFVAGGAIMQWPIGRLSDFIDRRQAIIGCCLGTAVTALTMTVMPFEDQWTAVAVAVLHGGFMVPLYPLTLAHVNDYAPNDELVEVSGGFLLLYSAGAISGPGVIGYAMDVYGGAALFIMMIGVFLGLTAFIAARFLIRRYVAEKLSRQAYAPVPKTTQSVYSLEADD